MSNRLTFSLASLVLIFALVFSAMPVMAADNGPVPTITAYSGLADPNTAASATNAAHKQSRTDFRLKVTFNALVDGTVDEDSFTVVTAEAAGKATSAPTASGIGTVVAITEGTDAGKAYMVPVNFDTMDATYSNGYVSFTFNAEVVTGNQAGHTSQGITNQKSSSFALTTAAGTLPKHTDWTLTPMFVAGTLKDDFITAAGDDKGNFKDTAEFQVKFTLSGGMGDFPDVATDGPAQIQIKDKDGMPVSGIAGVYVRSGVMVTGTYTATGTDTTPPVFIGVNPNWAAGNTIQVPAADAPTPDSVDPTVDISLIGMPDKAAKTFEVKFTFAKADVTGMDDKTAADLPDMLDADDITLMQTDPTDATKMIEDDAYVVGDIIRTSAGRFVATVNYRLDPLPVYVGLADSVKVSATTIAGETPGDDDPKALKVGDDDTTTPPVDPVDPTVNAPAMPAKPTASINTDNDLKIDVMWTAVTGADEYIIKKYMGTTLVKTFPDDDPNTAMITASPYMVGPVPAADRGMSFTFTVTAKNAGGMSDPSPASDAVMIPMAPTVANNPPSFPTGSAIADIVIWKGHDWTSPGLPAAFDDHGAPGALLDDPYTTSPALPDGLSLKENHEAKVVITGMATAASAKTPYKFIATDKLGAKAELMFNITVLDPIVPTAPTAVTAMEEGDLGGLPANLNRKVNSNKVVVNWTAPVDTTVTSHNPAIPFGAPITGYKVVQTYKEDGMVTTHPLPGTTAIKATDSSFTTPVLSVPRSKVGRGMYGFKVVAVNSVGDGAASTPAADTLIADVPHTKVNLDLRASNVPGNPNSATLDWQTPEDNGGADIVGYIIYRTLDDGPTVELKIGDVQSHRISNLNAGRHVFRVAAFNVDGLGGRSISTNFSVDVPIDPTNNLPTFGDKDIAHINATKGMAITGVTLPAATDPDNDSITYSISPRLPTGLTFRANTRFLSGTPTAAMASTVYTYTATDANGGEASLNFTIAVKSRVVVVPPATGDLAATYANGVTTIASGMIAANRFATIGSVSLPDLEEFFDLGGTIGLSNGDATDDKNSRTVVISEILWGNDLGAPVDDQTKWQFIELYNTTGTAISVTGWTLTFTEGRPVPAIDIDQVSNRSGGGWNLDKKATHGQSGRVTGTLATDLASAITPTNIISMYRNIDYVKVEKTYAEDNRKKQLDGFPSGNASGSWKSSQRRSAYNRWIYDSKRDKHFKPTDILAASTVGHHKWFRINEIGNAAGSTNDWIELYNMTDETRSLKNYALSVVTAKGTDTRILHFHDQDWKVDKKSYVVISTRHPRDTDLAAGKDISVADDQEENKGASHLFVVKTVNLPDDGKFTLILRNAHDKQGGDGHLEDVVATRQGAFADPNIGTSVWPLKATGLPHENVIDGGDENFAAGKVYQRNSGDGRGEKQLAVRGFTGIGYDRIAENTSVNGGTPGYDNGLIKEKIADLSDNKVSISEIMLGVGEGRQNLPQWVEIYNGSMIQAVNLNGWKLHVENSADVETALDAVLTLDSMVIPPNQTVLIVTNTGRVSDPDHFPSSRVVNLWTTKKHRDALEMIRRTDQVFSTTGVNLQLTDKDNKLVDEAGNLDGNRRTRNELDSTWTIPMNGNDDNRRSSLIRVYDAGVAVKGTMEKAWVLADETNLAYAISETYYGDPDDFGTPGFRGGGPLPVSLSKFRPERLDDGSIQIVWITESELNNAGFNILRSEKRDGEFKQINTSLIAGKGTTSERTTYTRVDTSAKPNVVYYYQIQDVSLDGKVTTLRQSRLKGNVSAAGKLTTTWGELKALQ